MIEFPLKLRALLLIVMLFFGFSATRGLSAEFRVTMDPEAQCSAIEVSGDIARADEARFNVAMSEAIARGPLRRIYLNSGGGDFYTATRMWDLIRGAAEPIDAVVPARSVCNSACVLLLAAASRRLVSSDAAILIHQAKNAKTQESSSIATLTYAFYLVESGFSRKVIDTLVSLKPDEQLAVTATNTKRLGFEGLQFYGSTAPPATRGCKWEGFLQ